MLKKNGNRIVKNVIVTHEQNEQIKAIGQRIGLSDSAVVRLALSQWLAERTQKNLRKILKKALTSCTTCAIIHSVKGRCKKK